MIDLPVLKKKQRNSMIRLNSKESYKRYACKAITLLSLSCCFWLTTLLSHHDTLAASRKKVILPDNQFEAKLSKNYFPLPAIHTPLVTESGGLKLRSLMVEAWVKPINEANLSQIRSSKKKISSALVADFSKISWDLFTDPRLGPDLAKRVVKNTVHRVSGSNIESVILKSFVLR